MTTQEIKNALFELRCEINVIRDGINALLADSRGMTRTFLLKEEKEAISLILDCASFRADKEVVSRLMSNGVLKNRKFSNRDGSNEWESPVLSSLGCRLFFGKRFEHAE